MYDCSDPLLDIGFEGTVIEWRGPAPFYFIAIPSDHLEEVSYAAREASYGWGCVPVAASIAGILFDTSLFPKDGSYLLPLKTVVRTQAGIALGDTIHVHMRVDRRPMTTGPGGVLQIGDAHEGMIEVGRR